MPHEPKMLLEDIRVAAEAIQEFTRGRSVTDYQTDRLLRAGVERWFIIIGEALTRLERLDASWSTRITDFRKITGFRNVLVHGYETINDEVVWRTIQEYVPALQSEVASHLSTLANS
jgi:uncharacterized protein with HEPN domain